MKLEYVPLLPVQRELHGMPRGPGRFQQYLRTILNRDGTGLELPSLVVMNPMGKDHVTALLEALLALDADGVAARAARAAAAQLADTPGDAAGRTLGFTPRGLSPWAGLALALHDARALERDGAGAPRNKVPVASRAADW